MTKIARFVFCLLLVARREGFATMGRGIEAAPQVHRQRPDLHA